MAMLFSVMSFAQDAPIYELVPASGSNNGYAANCDITIDGIKWNLTGNSTMQPWRIGGKGITNQDRALYSKTPLAYNIDKIEVIHGTASGITVNSFKLIISDEANGAGETIDVAFKASATTTIDLPEGDYTNKYFKFLYNVTNSTNNNKYLQFTGAKFYAALAADDVKAPIIKGAEDFISETEVTIEAEDDVTVYYTLDGTEPTTASTVYAAPFTVKETTTVKAVAYRGETASFVTSATFTQATRVTAAEAAELAMKVASNNALTSVTYVINAYVTEVIDQALSNGQQRFWVADTKDGGQVLQSYYCNVPQVLKVGDYVQMFGKLTKYNTNPQMKNGDVTIAEEPVIEEPTIECKDALDFGAVAYNAEVAAQTLEVTGYNLTSDITVTLSEGAAFTVDQTTLSAEGGNLVITPVSPLTVGTHTATLTLASGEATAEVTLTIVAKDVYTIIWSVNGEATTTSVVEGDKLVLPAAPEAPDACSEKVFVGWTAAEEVNADGSDIEWVTAATVPTADATYYAVFAVQEGEGGAAEEGTVTLAYTGTTTSNMDVEANNATIVGLDETKWNVQAAKGDNSNAPGLNKAGDIRLYYADPNSNTITVTSLDETVTISTIVITYTGDDYSNGKILVNDAAVTGTDGTYEINANSFTITNGNTSNVQVRIKNIVINYTTGAAATYTDYSTTCEAPVVNHTITVSANPAEGGVVTGGGEYEEGATANLTATANEGYEFVNWTENEVEVSTDAEYTFEVLANRALVANFKEVEPEVIAYELNGGELPAPAVPTNEELWIAFMPYYQEYYDVVRAEQPIASVAVFLSAGMGDDATIFTSEDSDYKWLGDYIIKVTTEQSAALTTLANWKFNAQAFFNANQYTGWPKSADFTEAGKPENWGAAYQAAHAVVLPTEPVAEDYVLPTPVKEGYKFVGWYDNAEGTGEAYTVIPAGWSGTLYAIWEVEGPATALENIAVEGKAVKAIVNGQLIIIKNGVQYNAQGAVVK